jgi:hypothetical protein
MEEESDGDLSVLESSEEMSNDLALAGGELLSWLNAITLMKFLCFFCVVQGCLDGAV